MSTPHIPLSILDLVPLSEGQDAREGIAVSMRAAQAADRSGYSRYWYAEHHNAESLASSATSLLIDRAARGAEAEVLVVIMRKIGTATEGGRRGGTGTEMITATETDEGVVAGTGMRDIGGRCCGGAVYTFDELNWRLFRDLEY